LVLTTQRYYLVSPFNRTSQQLSSIFTVRLGEHGLDRINRELRSSFPTGFSTHAIKYKETGSAGRFYHCESVLVLVTLAADIGQTSSTAVRWRLCSSFPASENLI
jgi:hypothetical protein